MSDTDHKMYVARFREAVLGLALDPADQIAAETPGCVMCEVLEEYERWSQLYLEEFEKQLSVAQLNLINGLTAFAQSEAVTRYECWEKAVLSTPPWNELRQLARQVLQAFGWPLEKLPGFQEISPGVWKREYFIKE